MNNIELFNFDTHEVRVLIHEETKEPWWVASDVCKVLELQDVSMSVKRLDDDEKLVQKLFVSGQNRQVTLINEAGLYGLVLTSNKPQAKQFKRWIKHDVLPSIRKTGTFNANSEAKQIPTDILEVLKNATAEIEAGRIIISELKPKALFHDTVAVAINSQSVEAIAKVLNTGRNRMFNWLREKGYFQGEGQSKNLPYQKWIDSGLFKVIEKTRKNQVGENELYTQTLVTGKGLTKIQAEFQ
ncbi:COG3617 Prophage antirepressor [uncultured Caudovirales phage]|uniref:COG3617 Prophage antirepressor n=1 Tax=uncultured Caudovirales phage TaxID=2100421 RepID=A0A6J5LXU0_9CAUD|nr:COG3617 Prophage antirepressor [uncultured Caudovirales phage]